MVQFRPVSFVLPANKFLIRINILILMILFFLFRSSIPAFKYPFLILFLYYLSDTILVQKNNLKNVKYFVKTYILIISLVVIYFLSIFESNKFFLEIFKDALNILILLSFLFFLRITIKSKNEFQIFVQYLIKYIISFSVFISVYGIYKYFQIYLSNDLIRYSELLLIDYNFALLPVFFGMLSIIYQLPKINSFAKILFYNLFLLILTIQVLLSSSRRAFIIINVILVLLYLNFIVSIFFKDYFLKSFIKKNEYYLISIGLLFVFVYFFIFGTTYSFKQKTFEKLGVKKIIALQDNITGKCYRYLSIFDRNTSYSTLYKNIWAPIFDPKDPDSGWGTRIHKTIFPLIGQNDEIVPPDVKGYLMDSTCNAYVMNDNSYSYTDLFLYENKVKDKDIVTVSVYCYVSKDFNGDWSLIALTNYNLGWIGSESYNLEKKGTWQKLVFSRTCKEGDISVYLYFCKNGVNDFASLKGYVIFAYPECNISTEKDLNKRGEESNIELVNKSRYESTRGTTKSLMADNSNLLSLVSPLILFRSSLFQEQDPIRKFASRLISEDTTYHGYNANIVIDTVKNSFIALRYVRWQFAWQIFTKEYNWRQKIIGGGFNFLNWYSYFFLKDRTKTDYPHNPFLYILLYSGIVGLLFYLVLVFKVFYYYIKYLKEYYLLFIFFLITFFFVFFSGGNPFDPPIMGFFVILPFFIHSIYKKEINEPSSVSQENNDLIDTK